MDGPKFLLQGMSRQIQNGIALSITWPEAREHFAQPRELISSGTSSCHPALPGIQNIQQANFFCQTAAAQRKPQTFSIVMIISGFVAA